MNWYVIAQATNILSFNPQSASREVMNQISVIMRSKGYDIGNGDYCRNALITKPHLLENEDWAEAIQTALDRSSNRKTNLNNKKVEKEQYSNIDWAMVKKLGFTGDYREAGYIDLEGRYVNLSGGLRGQRGEDHRIVGGTNGMQELLAYGYIRLGIGWCDIRKNPTDKQYKKLAEHIGVFLGDRRIGRGDDYHISLDKGLGEFDTGWGLRLKTREAIDKSYHLGSDIGKILNDIRGYFS